MWSTLGVGGSQAAAAAASMVSTSTGGSLPRARRRRGRLYVVSIQTTIGRRCSWRVRQRRVFRTFFCSSEKKLCIAALSPEEPTRPKEPRKPLFFRSRTTLFDRN